MNEELKTRRAAFISFFILPSSFEFLCHRATAHRIWQQPTSGGSHETRGAALEKAAAGWAGRSSANTRTSKAVPSPIGWERARVRANEQNKN
jgi:hypothetical protein